MSAYGTFSPTARPQGSCQHPWALPTPRVRHVAGVQGKPPAPLPQSVGRLQPVKAKLLRGCFASLDRFPAPSASVSFATPTEMERGQGRRSRAFYPLTPWNRPNTHRRGRWIGFATCPCGLASESGFGAKPQGLVFCF